MGDVIDIRDENMTSEKQEVATLCKNFRILTTAINSLFEDFKLCWQDEKSECWIAKQQSLLDDLKTSIDKAEKQADAYMQEIIDCLKLYSGN